MRSNILPISLLMASLVPVYFFSPPLVLKACGIQWCYDHEQTLLTLYKPVRFLDENFPLFRATLEAQNEFLNGPAAYPPPGVVRECLE